MVEVMMYLATEDSGTTAIEYGLLGALIAVACMASVTLVGGSVEILLDFIAGHLTE